ncbi:hypothetical protein niasHT_002773 [Heterodera trifolii]|uniref:Secreted protein n=1 Tax=Heterodera trifolii TaxID=157864 RepID=A0ABD2M859_9BILA
MFMTTFVVLLSVVCVVSAFFGGGFGFGGDGCCCGDCCCDCCCGCSTPVLLALPCSCCDSFGLYGGSIFGGRRRRKRQEIEVKREELYADKGPKSVDFLNNHKCADPIWLTLLARKWAKESEEKAAENEQQNVTKPIANSPPHSSKIVREGPNTRRMKRQLMAKLA